MFFIFEMDTLFYRKQRIILITQYVIEESVNPRSTVKLSHRSIDIFLMLPYIAKYVLLRIATPCFLCRSTLILSFGLIHQQQTTKTTFL